jgi:hypothetical protein
VAEVNEAADLANVNPKSDFVPGELTGEIHAGVPGGGRPIAVALNGTIAATGRTFSLEGSSVESLEVLVPETAFRRGRNEARVFEIVPRGGGGVALRPL